MTSPKESSNLPENPKHARLYELFEEVRKGLSQLFEQQYSLEEWMIFLEQKLFSGMSTTLTFQHKRDGYSVGLHSHVGNVVGNSYSVTTTLYNRGLAVCVITETEDAQGHSSHKIFVTGSCLGMTLGLLKQMAGLLDQAQLSSSTAITAGVRGGVNKVMG